MSVDTTRQEDPLQPLADGVQPTAAVGGAEQGGQAVAALGGQGLIELLGRLAAVDHAEHLRVPGQPGGEFLLRQGAEVLQGGAPEHFVEAGRVGRDLLPGGSGAKRRNSGSRAGWVAVQRTAVEW